MCVTSRPADLSKTTVMVYQTNGGIRVLGYQNTARNLQSGSSGFGWNMNTPTPDVQGNAMILPIDARHWLGEANLVFTEKMPHVMDDMVSAVTPSYRGVGTTRGGISKGAISIVQMGIYTVVFANKAEQDVISDALSQIEVEKRPELSAELIESYLDNYPEWPLAICCFDTTQETKATPLIFKYKPFREDLMYFPGLDSHTGQAPNLRSIVDRDHWLIAAHGDMDGGDRVRYQDPMAHGHEFLPSVVVGMRVDTPTKNGDWIMPMEDIFLGNLSRMDVAPPPGSF